MVTYRKRPDTLVFDTDRARWAVWRRPMTDGNRFVGAGYLGRVTLADGRVIVDDYRRDSTQPHVNQPDAGGLGCFGVHLARRNGFYPHDPPNYTWDLTGRMDATRHGGYGVSHIGETEVEQIGADLTYGILVAFTDGESRPNPLITVTYAYRFRPDRVDQAVTVQMTPCGSPVFVKEPKVVAHCLHGYSQIDVLGPNRKLLDRRDLTRLPDPSHGTFQMGQTAREACVFRGAGLPDVTVSCDRGLEQWADAADQAEPLHPDGARYCLKPDGKLKRQWESAHWKEKPWAGVMLHAWEGGAGIFAPGGGVECPQASRRVTAPAAYTTRLTYRVG